MRKTVHRFARLVPLVAIVVALMVPTVALAADMSIQPQSANLVAKGAEVDVAVSFTCPAGLRVTNWYGMPGGATAYLQQAVTKTEQAAGSGWSGGQTCTGQQQTGLIPVLASIPGPPFRNGPVVVSAYLQACDASFNCLYAASGAVTIRISH